MLLLKLSNLLIFLLNSHLVHIVDTLECHELSLQIEQITHILDGIILQCPL